MKNIKTWGGKLLAGLLFVSLVGGASTAQAIDVFRVDFESYTADTHPSNTTDTCGSWLSVAGLSVAADDESTVVATNSGQALLVNTVESEIKFTPTSTNATHLSVLMTMMPSAEPPATNDTAKVLLYFNGESNKVYVSFWGGAWTNLAASVTTGETCTVELDFTPTTTEIKIGANDAETFEVANSSSTVRAVGFKGSGLVDDIVGSIPDIPLKAMRLSEETGVYGGTALTPPTATVTDVNNATVNSDYYDLVISNGTEQVTTISAAGTYTFYATGKDGYSGTVTNEFVVSEAKAGIVMDGDTSVTNYYATLQAAVDAVAANSAISLLADTYEAVTVSKALTVTRNGFNAPNLTAGEGYYKTETSDSYVFAAQPETLANWWDVDFSETETLTDTTAFKTNAAGETVNYFGGVFTNGGESAIVDSALSVNTDTENVDNYLEWIPVAPENRLSTNIVELTAALADSSDLADIAIPSDAQFAVTATNGTIVVYNGTAWTDTGVPTDGAATAFKFVFDYSDSSSPKVDVYTNGVLAKAGIALTKAAAQLNSVMFAGSGTVDNFKGGIEGSATLLPVDVPVAKTGLFYNGSQQEGVTNGTGYTVSGGSGTEAGNYVAEVALTAGYIWSDDNTTTNKFVPWSIAPAGAVVTTGGESPSTTYYATLADAITAAASDATITLGGDAMLTTTPLSIADGKSLILDLAGHTISGAVELASAPILVTTTGNLTVTNSTEAIGSVVSTTTNSISNAGTLSLVGGNFASGGDVTSTIETAEGATTTLGLGTTYDIKPTVGIPDGCYAAEQATDPETWKIEEQAFTLDPVAQELYYNCTSQVAVVGAPAGATFYWTEEVIPGQSSGGSGGISFGGDTKPLSVSSGRKTDTLKFYSNTTNGTWHLTASVTNENAEIAQLVATVTVKDVAAVVDGVEYTKAQLAQAVADAIANDKVLGLYVKGPDVQLAAGQTIKVKALCDCNKDANGKLTVTGPAGTDGTVYVVGSTVADGVRTYALTAETPSVMFVSADGVTTNYLDAAFKATKAGTYKLLKDVTRSQLSVGTTGVVLDLNGKTFTSTATGTTAAINVTSTTGTAGLTVIDSSEAGTGAIVAPNYSAIQSGKNASVAIEGGAISGKTVLVYTLSGGTVAISGGTFSMVSGSADSMLNCKDDNRGTITVTGGSFNGFNPSTSNAADGDMVATGYVSVADDPSSGWYTVYEAVTVSFVNDKGAAPEAQVIGKGKTATKPADPAAVAGFRFDGWFAEGAEEAFDFDTAIAADLTLTAKWTPTTATVIWVVEGTQTEETYDIGATPVYPGATPTKAGTDSSVYVFTGWSPALGEVTAAGATYTAQFSLVSLSPASLELYPNCSNYVQVAGAPAGSTYTYKFAGHVGCDSYALNPPGWSKTEGWAWPYGKQPGGTGTITVTVTNDNAQIAVLTANVTVKDVAAVVDGVEYASAQFGDALNAAKTGDKVLEVYYYAVSYAKVALGADESIRWKPADNRGKASFWTSAVTVPATTDAAWYKAVASKDNETGVTTITCVNQGVPYVKIDDGTTVTYSTESFTSMSKAGTTYTLLRDMTDQTGGVVSKAGVILDLNGKKLGLATGIKVAGNSAGSLTIRDTSQAGTGEISGGNDSSPLVWVTGGGTATIESGTFVSDGTTAVYTENGTASITGGTFSTTAADKSFLINCKDSNKETITVTGGSFQGFNPQNNTADGEGTDYVASGYYAFPNDPSAGWYTVAEKKSVIGTTITVADAEYDGTAKEPVPTVAFGGATLTATDDYTVAYASNTNAGTATVTITGANGWKDFTNVTFAIAQRPLSLTAMSDSKVYDGTPLTKEGIAYDNPGQLLDGHDVAYVVSGSQTDAGTSDNVISSVTIKDANQVDVTANYALTLNKGTLTVTRADVTITVAGTTDTSLEYNGQDQTVTVDSSKYTLVCDNPLYVANKVQRTATSAAARNVGNNYALGLEDSQFSYNDANVNATFVVTDGTFTITAKAVNITVADASKTYGAADPAFTGEVTGLVNEGDLGTITYSRTGDGENVGTYTGVLTASYTANGNYTVTVVPGNFTIAAADISKAVVTLEYPSHAATDGALEPSVVSVVLGTTTLAADTDYTVSYSDNVAVGTATVTVTGKGNYTGSATATFTIIDGTTTLWWDNDFSETETLTDDTAFKTNGEGKVEANFGGVFTKAAGDSSSIENKKLAVSTGTESQDDYLTWTPVEPAAHLVTNTLEMAVTLSDYDELPADIECQTAVAATNGVLCVWNGAEWIATATAASEDETVLKFMLDYTVPGAAKVDVYYGGAVVTQGLALVTAATRVSSVQFAGSGTVDNFRAEQVGDSAATPIEVPAALEGLFYNGSLQEGVTNGTGYTVVSGGSGTAAGNYVAEVALATGYIWSDDNTTTNKFVPWSIAPAGAVVTTGGESPSTTYYATLADAITAAASDATITLGGDAVLTTTPLSIAGKSLILDLAGHSITGTGITPITVANGGELTVTNSTETIGSVESTSSYAISNAGTLSLVGGNFASGGDVTSTIETAENATTTLGLGTTYDIKPTVGIPDGCYAAKQATDPETWKIEEQSGFYIFLTSNNAVYTNDTYKGSAFAVTATVKDGTGESANVVSSNNYVLVISNATAEVESIVDAGTYTYYAIPTEGSPYTGTATAVFTVDKAAITVAATAGTKVYGEADPALAYTSSGLLGSDALEGALARAEGEDVGTYAISQGTLTAGSNYTIDFTAADFTITAAAVTITVADASKTYGAADPAFTGAVTGLVNEGDLGTITYSRTGDGENVGTYTGVLTASYTANANYSVTVVPGDFEITAKAVTVTVAATADTKTYTGAEQSFTPALSYTSDETGTPLFDSSKVTFAGTATLARTDVGTTQQELAAGQFAYTDNNLAVTFVVETDGKLTIEKASITVAVTAVDQTATYTGEAITKDVKLADAYTLASEDSLYDASKVTRTATEVTGTNAGDYPYNLATSQFGYDDENVTATFTLAADGKLTIEKAKYDAPTNVQWGSDGANSEVVWTKNGETWGDMLLTWEAVAPVKDETVTYSRTFVIYNGNNTSYGPYSVANTASITNDLKSYDNEKSTDNIAEHLTRLIDQGVFPVRFVFTVKANGNDNVEESDAVTFTNTIYKVWCYDGRYETSTERQLACVMAVENTSLDYTYAADNCEFGGWYTDRTYTTAFTTVTGVQDIFAKMLSGLAGIQFTPETATFTGFDVTPTAVVTNAAGVTLVKDTDYTLVVSNGTAEVFSITNAGSYTYYATAIGSTSTGTVSAVFTVLQAGMTNLTITGVKEKYQTQTGAEAPEATLKLGEYTLVKDTDYSVTASPEVDMDAAGTYTLTFNGQGNFFGSTNVTFKVVAVDGVNPGGSDVDGVSYASLADGKPALELDSDGFTVRFVGAADVTYTLEYIDDLAYAGNDANWSPVTGSAVTPTETVLVELTDAAAYGSNAPAKRFYRIKSMIE